MHTNTHLRTQTNYRAVGGTNSKADWLSSEFLAPPSGLYGHSLGPTFKR